MHGMSNFINKVGLHAGHVWESLSSYGPMTTSELMTKTGLTRQEIFWAVGWLARENKILNDGGRFLLGETNLTSIIGKNAGRIWKILNEEAMDDFFSAVGWLAREGMINNIQWFIDKKFESPETLDSKDEITNLYDEIETRNAIIDSLRNQLSDNCMKTINDFGIMKQLKEEIDDFQHHINIQKMKLDHREQELSILRTLVKSKDVELQALRHQIQEENTTILELNEKSHSILLEGPRIQRLWKTSDECESNTVNTEDLLITDNGTLAQRNETNVSRVRSVKTKEEV
jgi:hypothetical protein